MRGMRSGSQEVTVKQRNDHVESDSSKAMAFMSERFYRPLIFKLQVAGLIAAVCFLLFFVNSPLFFETPYLFVFTTFLYL